MSGHVLQVRYDDQPAREIRQQPSRGRDDHTRTNSCNVGGGGYYRQRRRGTNRFDDVENAGYGYSRQPRPNRMAKGQTFVTVSWTQYIPHHEAQEYERLGWTITDALTGSHHGVHSVLGVWRSDDPNAIPPKPDTSGR